MMNLRKLSTATLTVALCLPAMGHDGRRFEVKVIDGKLFALGYDTTGNDDGAGAVRGYYNALHDHFSNSDSVADFASATLPGFDVADEADTLIGYDLVWNATGFKKWSSPATSGPVSLSELDSDELIAVVNGGDIIRSDQYDAGGTAMTSLLASFNGGNGLDLDLSYEFYGDNPSGEIYVIESVLSTSAPGIESSDTVYTLLSPDGDTMMQRLHHPALYLESQLGTPVPEPGSLALLAGMSVLCMRRRCRNA